MKPSPSRIQTIYLSLTLINTLAASFIWGINTLFLLDAGLSNAQAFLANAFFTVGQVLFEVPTGIVADLQGRRASYLLGTVVLALSTMMYLGAWYIHAPLVVWAVASILLGLGFTFFSGATEAWLVDALAFSGYAGALEPVFAKAQMVGGVAMLLGSVTGGVVAQFSHLGVPYFIRAGLLGLNFVIAWAFMKDWGFKPDKRTSVVRTAKKLFVESAEFGWKHPAVRWMMLAAPFTTGVSFYVFYAMQPFLLKLYGDERAYGVAGLAAAIVAAAQIIGGFLVPHIGRWFKTRTALILVSSVTSVVMLLLISLTTNFWVAIGLLCGWGLVFALAAPARQAYLNGLIPSKQRATVLSFDSLMGSSGGVVIQPALGKVADIWSYPTSFLGSALMQAMALPFIYLARQLKVSAEE